MAEGLCVNKCGRKARRNPESKGLCLECSLEKERIIKREPPTLEEVCACGAKSTDPGATRFKDGKCKKCRQKEAQRRFLEKKKGMKRSAENTPKNKTQVEFRGGGRPLKTRNRRPKEDMPLIITVDFSGFPGLYEEITERGKEELRPPEMQILYHLKEALKP